MVAGPHALLLQQQFINSHCAMPARPPHTVALGIMASISGKENNVNIESLKIVIAGIRAE